MLFSREIFSCVSRLGSRYSCNFFLSSSIIVDIISGGCLSVFIMLHFILFEKIQLIKFEVVVGQCESQNQLAAALIHLASVLSRLSTHKSKFII